MIHRYVNRPNFKKVTVRTDNTRPRGLGKRARIATHLLRRFFWCLGALKFVDTTFVNSHIVPKKKGVIVASNHTSLSDIIFLWSALRRPGIALAMAELWAWPIVGRLVRILGQIPVVRGNAESGTRALSAARKYIEHDGLCIIFPEGGCVSPGETRPYKRGVATLAFETGVDVIPAGINGANRVFPLKRDRTGRKFLFLRERVRVSFGEPLNARDCIDEKDFLNKLRERIEALSQ